MILAFLDECSDSKFKDYLGLSLAVMNASFYPQIKSEAQNALVSGGWDPSVEFKGEVLFSASKGCTDVDVASRVELAELLLSLHVAKTNRRVQFYYAQAQSRSHRDDYLNIAPALIAKALPKPDTKGGKNLLSIVCDHRTDISVTDLTKTLEPIARSRGYVLHEQVVLASSNFHTVGLMYADLVGYLIARIDTIANDAEFLQSIPPEFFETNGKLRKLRTSQTLINNVKKLKLFKVKI